MSLPLNELRIRHGLRDVAPSYDSRRCCGAYREIIPIAHDRFGVSVDSDGDRLDVQKTVVLLPSKITDFCKGLPPERRVGVIRKVFLGPAHECRPLTRAVPASPAFSRQHKAVRKIGVVECLKSGAKDRRPQATFCGK